MKNNFPYRNGFTLIESIVTIVLISILAVIAIPRWPSSVNLSAQCQQIASAIRYTQSLALTHDQSYRIQFTNASYSIVDNSGNVVTNPVSNQNATTLTNVTIAWTNLANSLIYFDGQGVPYTDAAGTTVLASTATVMLTSNGITYTVSIVPQTGRVSVP